MSPLKALAIIMSRGRADLEEGEGLRLLPLHLIEGRAQHPLCQVLPGIGNRLLAGALGGRLLGLCLLQPFRAPSP